MKNSKLYKIFALLNAQQKLSFTKFLHSPYYNKREDVRNLWAYLRASESEKGEISKQEAYAKIWPQEAYNDVKIRHTMSYLLDYLELFLAQKTGGFNNLEAALNLLKAYRKLNFEAGIPKLQQDLKAKLEAQPYRDAQYWQFHYQLELEIYLHSEQAKRSSPRNLQALTQSLDYYYLAEKLKLSCLQFAHASVYKIEYDYGLLNVALEYLAENPEVLTQSAIAIYYHYYLAISSEQQESFEHFNALLDEHERNFEPEERWDLYVLAINYGIKQINKGISAYLRLTLNRYQRGLSLGVLTYRGELSRFSFKNILAIALKLEEFEFVEAFIEDYHGYLPEVYRQSYLHYAWSKLAFTQGDYGRALTLLRSVEYDELFMNIDAKIMLMKLFYETQAWDLLDAFLHSFKAFLRRRRVDLSYHYENYKNIISVMNLLTRSNLHDALLRSSLRKRIEGVKVLSERDWFLSRLLD